MLLYTINFTVWRSADMCTYLHTYAAHAVRMWANGCFIRMSTLIIIKLRKYRFGTRKVQSLLAATYAWSEGLMATARPHKCMCHPCSEVNQHVWVMYCVHNNHIFQSGPMEVPRMYMKYYDWWVYVHHLVMRSECMPFNFCCCNDFCNTLHKYSCSLISVEPAVSCKHTMIVKVRW